MAPNFLSLLIFLLSATVGGQRHDHWGHHSVHHKSATSNAPSIQIRQSCKATHFPNICESTLSDLDSLPPNPSPSDFILATGLQTTHSMIQSILDAFKKASNITAPAPPAFASRSSLSSIAAFSTALLAGALGDARAWASAALLYQYDSWSGLKYVNGTTQVFDAMAFTSLPFPFRHRHWPESSLIPLFSPVEPNRGFLFYLLGLPNKEG